MLSYANLPAALEISQDCCDVLEQAADALDMRQQRFEISAEKEKWQGLWLLTQDVGVWVEEHMNKTEESQEEVVEVIPEAELLKLKTWLELSERIFMNPGPPREHENWRSFAPEGGETPSIRYTAFADFHTLAVSITQRLVQATLFFAMSRQRSTDSKIFGSKPLVTAKDVRAAIKVLGMKPDSKEIWRGVGRRCGLHIYQKISELRKKGGPSPLSYDEVEAMLGGGKKSGPTTTGSAPDFASSVCDISISEDSGEDVALEPSPHPSRGANSSDSWGSDESGPDSGASIYAVLQSSEATETSSSETNTTHTNPPKRPKTGESPSVASHASEDLYAAALDHRASLLEEKSLWSLLDQTPPFPLNPEEVELPPRPRCLRKRREELVDWRDRVEYRAVWETVGPVVAGKEEFLGPGTKGGDEDDGSARSSSGDS
jgi:RNA polymerase I-specific transcription initiation factor RRN5